jgi:predicted regulator of Ras-like GTPase activity (Roadblock/LC7/MglB family)
MEAYTHHLSGGVKILPNQMKDINRLISELYRRIPASFVMLADKSGQNLFANGDIGGANLITLSALIAGDFAASQEIARLTGEYGNHQLVLREGDRSHTLISEAGPHLILFVQASSTVPLGWARMQIRDASRNLEGILAAPSQHTKPFGTKVDFVSMRDQFSRALEDLLSE